MRLFLVISLISLTGYSQDLETTAPNVFDGHPKVELVVSVSSDFRDKTGLTEGDIIGDVELALRRSGISMSVMYGSRGEPVGNKQDPDCSTDFKKNCGRSWSVSGHSQQMD
jgi:hypothetical protein